MTRRSAAFLLLMLAGCDDTPGQWSAYVYPDARDGSKWTRTDRLKNEGMCKQAAEESIAALPEPKKASYRCVRTGPPG
jgi:hypothetical protein